MTARLIEWIDVADTVGECVLWRAEDSTVWWTDIPGRGPSNKVGSPYDVYHSFDEPVLLAAV